MENLAKNDAEHCQNQSNIWGKHRGRKKWVKVGSVSPDSWARGYKRDTTHTHTNLGYQDILDTTGSNWVKKKIS